MSKKRPREVPAVDIQLVEIYEDLANDNEEIRIKATHALLNKSSPESGFTAEQLKEILRRLIRGLCSGRKGARLGFSIALTELLSQIFGANANRALPMSNAEFIQLLKKETEVPGNVSGQEKRDHYFGRLFGAETVIKSGILYNHADLLLWSQVVGLIVELAKRKSWLREECGWVLFQAVQGSGANHLSSEHVQTVIDRINENELMESPEGVAIWIITLENYSTINFPRKLWKHQNPLHRKEKSRLAKIMREVPTSNVDESVHAAKHSGKGTWSSKLHFAWEVILDRLVKSPLSGDKSLTKSKNELKFPDFWDECVERSLFADSSSNERKYWGFLLFQRMFQHVSHFPAEVLFSPNLMRCLINQVCSPGRYLHLAAEKTIKVLLRRVKSETTMAVVSLNGLMKPPNGEVNFDQITKTKTVEKIVNMVSDSCLHDLLQLLRKLAISPGVQDEKGAASRRRVIGDLLLSTVRSRSTVTSSKLVPSEAEQSIQQILSLLVELAYFARNNESSHAGDVEDLPISSASHEMFRVKILSCLTDLASKSKDPSTFAYHVVCAIKSQYKQPTSFIPLLVMDDAVAAVMKKAWELLGIIDVQLLSSPPQNRPLLIAFKLLYSLTILQVFNGDVDAINMVEELEESYHKLQIEETSKSSGGPEVLVEIILSLVAKPALLFRRIGPHVFSACAPYINETALQPMIQVLTTKENMTGQEEIFDRNEDDEDDTSEIEQIDENGVAEVNMHDDSSIANDTNEGSDTFSENDEDDAAFNAKLAQALETGSGKIDGQQAGDDESSETDMDDDQMEALDEQLAKIFKERKIASSKKTQRKDAKEAMINFKCRVLELLEVFVKEQHTKPIGLKLLIPLLTTIRVTKSKLVLRKACDLVREYTRLCKGKNIPNVDDQDAIFDLLAIIHAEAMREGSHAYTSACSQASLLVVRALMARARENLHQIILRYAATQERFASDLKCKVKGSFFGDFTNWCDSGRNHHG